MDDWLLFSFACLAWCGTGLTGAYLLRYPGDRLNASYLFGMLTGPVALLIAAAERGWPD